MGNKKRNFAQANTLLGKTSTDAAAIVFTNRLHAAIAQGHLSDLQDLTLTSTMNNSSEKNEAGFTPLAAAVMARSASMVETLLETSWDLAINEKCGPDERTALIIAIQDKNLDIVKLLMTREETDSNIFDKHGNSAFNYAVAKIYLEAGKFNIHDEEIAIKVISHRNTKLNEYFDQEPTVIALQFAAPSSVLMAYSYNPNADLVFLNADGTVRHSVLSFILNTGGELDELQAVLSVTDRDIGINRNSMGPGTALSEAINATYKTHGDFWCHLRAMQIVDRVMQREDLDVNIAHDEQPMVEAVLDLGTWWTDYLERLENDCFCEKSSLPLDDHEVRNFGFYIIQNFVTHPMLLLEDPERATIFENLIIEYESDSDDECGDTLTIFIDSEIDRILEKYHSAQEEIHTTELF